jgi:hypothetical protein
MIEEVFEYLRYGLIGLNVIIFIFAWKMLNNYLAASSSPEKDETSVLLVVAHPDDEVMFFTPTLLALQREGRKVKNLFFSFFFGFLFSGIA